MLGRAQKLRFARFMGIRLSTILCTATILFFTPATALAWVDPTTGLSHPTHVTRRAEIPEKNWHPGHRGVDLAARPGAPVMASGGGTVAFVGVVAGTPVISIDHPPSEIYPEGLRTTYQPVNSSLSVGDSVDEGQVIGTLARPVPAHSGEHDGLHWGVRTGPDAYIDPLTLLDAPRIRLKPATQGDRPKRADALGRIPS